VQFLVARSLSDDERAGGCGQELMRELRSAAATFTRRETALRDLVDALATHQIDALILKGTALAYTVYPEPYLRPRVDVDLLIQRDAVERTERVLASQGWVRDAESDREFASAQRHYAKDLGAAGIERVDLHWRMVNPPALAHVLAFDDVRPRAMAISQLGPAARTLTAGDALFLACLHLAVHHGDDAAHLLWLMDLHLLARALDATERARFLALVARGSMRDVCRSCLEAAHDCFQGTATSTLIADLAALPPDATSSYARPSTKATLLIADLLALPTWRRRAILLREHLFPSIAYLRSKYPACPRALLPFAAIYRIIVGVPGWFVARAKQTDGR
jgi:Uncharacterised nucleotidyltransferase